MQLKFKSSGGNNGNFAVWAKQFKEISDCLLIEADTVENKFVAKSFTQDKALVKRSEIGFDEAGYSLESIKLDKSTPSLEVGRRVKIGVFMILGKFIDVIKTFSNVEHTMTVNFDKNTEKDTVEYHAQSIVFQSKSLSIKVSTANISEFDEVSDDMFFKRVFVAKDPFTVAIPLDTVKNLLSVSSLLSTAPMQDIMTIYVKKSGSMLKCYARDDNDGTYDYCIGEAKGAEADSEVTVKVFRYKLAMALNALNTDIELAFASSAPSRVLITGNNGHTKAVISAVCQ